VAITLAQGSPTVTADEGWEALQQHPIPEWFKDAKLGIYAHWGVYCVPAFGHEWYPRKIYLTDTKEHRHHVETYGDPSKFGYKDFIPSFTAENFDAEQWAELYEAAGAKFAGPVAEHHDGFSMWPSKVNRWNAGNMGPKRDVVGELANALRKRGIKIIASFHHGYNFQGYYVPTEGWDVADPEYYDLYGQFDDVDEAHDRWLVKIKEVIDAYQPDQIWFDFGLDKIPDEVKLEMAAYYYDHEKKWGKEVIITRKGNHLPEGVGVLDIERGKMEGVQPLLWQTDDSIATNSWCYVQNLQVKPSEELVHELIDIVSKNGVLLLNVCPKADGTFPDDQKKLLHEIGDWLEVNGEGIYGTRPWHLHGEGSNVYDKGRGLGDEGTQVDFTAGDVRFTKKGDDLYAICLGWPDGPVALESVLVRGVGSRASVTLLGHDEPLKFSASQSGTLIIEPPDLAPDDRPCDHAYTFRISGIDVASRLALPLDMSQAVVEGLQVQVGEQDGRPVVRIWDLSADRAHWLVKILEPGTYQVEGEFTVVREPLGIAVDVAGQSVHADLPLTTEHIFSKIGTVKFDEPGVYHLKLRGDDPESWKHFTVWNLELALIR
jgi:alpha-L-fucosidase